MYFGQYFSSGALFEHFLFEIQRKVGERDRYEHCSDLSFKTWLTGVIWVESFATS